MSELPKRNVSRLPNRNVSELPKRNVSGLPNRNDPHSYTSNSAVITGRVSHAGQVKG